jgi:hypothetical protein
MLSHVGWTIVTDVDEARSAFFFQNQGIQEGKFLDPKDEGKTIVRNLDNSLTDNTA